MLGEDKCLFTGRRDLVWVIVREFSCGGRVLRVVIKFSLVGSFYGDVRFFSVLGGLFIGFLGFFCRLFGDGSGRMEKVDYFFGLRLRFKFVNFVEINIRVIVFSFSMIENR